LGDFAPGQICNTPNENFQMKIFDWCIAKSIEFRLVEIVHFVPNSPPLALKNAKLHHFYVNVLRENASVTPFHMNIWRKTQKLEFCSALRPGQNFNTMKNNPHFYIAILALSQSTVKFYF
jgi:hypothetical protein